MDKVQMQRDEYGKFVTKSGEHRAVRSLRLSDTTWSAMAEMAESRSLTKADLLEQMFKSKLDSQPGNTRKEIESPPGNTRVNIKQREDVVAQLRAENARLLNLVQKLSEVKDLEMVRDSVLSGLKLGQQAPKYKMVKSVLDQFIKLLRHSV
jgi:delta-aminolevulinic acid dehydratase/porphobilinogen synthase